MVTFKPMLSHDFLAFVDYFVVDYASEIASSYRLSEADALLQARRETEASFPDGEKSAGQVVLCITQTHLGEEQHIGYLWYKPDSELKSIYINDFYLFPQFRGQGLGSEAMKCLEEQLIQQGYNQIKLRVAADNRRARQVYETNGFAVTGINMNKILGVYSHPASED
ncbi:GNAT family N-acetyltransferase [Buttiauxella sp. S04-F03]|uniref:GNAT family N-acetyltransferase n=1 Tax=Buttiauxella sp. W03-F01 TaxID=2904524 RepID=UPI001E4EA085|nr:GNAT family N-acetyltransferase [Buttiauxella sp. W03-F01]MCE0799218.1 GNAT family N-acetyltransferase [Buttiauxella sp. W03-F01]